MSVAEAIDLARRLLDEGRLEEALTTLLKTAEEHAHPDLDLEIALVYTERGLARPDEEALADFAEAESWAELPLTWVGKAGVLTRRGEFGEAEQLLRRALEADDQMPEALLGMASLRLAQGRVDEAGELASAAVQSSPRSSEGWLFLATVLERAGRKDDAMKALEEALKYDPLNAALLVAVASRSKDADAAARALRRAVELDPENAEAWRGLARAEARAGNEIEMHEAVDRARALDPEGTKAWLEDAKKAEPLLGTIPE